MTSAEFFCPKEIVHDHLGQLGSYYTLSHCDDLAVVVLFDHLGGIAVGADACADSGHLVGCQGNPYACSAYKNAFIDLSAADRLCDRPAGDGIIQLLLRAVCAIVHTLIALRFQVLD